MLCRSGCIAGVSETAKKGTLKLDLQALTVGAALLTMHRWLTQLRDALLVADGSLANKVADVSTAAAQEVAAQLEANRKLAVINVMGDHNRAQGNSSAVKEAVGAALVGAKAPFRLVQDHSRSGRLEAATPALRKWLLSDAFEWCVVMQVAVLHQFQLMRFVTNSSLACAQVLTQNFLVVQVHC